MRVQVSFSGLKRSTNTFRQSAFLSFTPLGATPTKSQPAPLTHEFGRRDSKQAGAAAVMLLHPEIPSCAGTLTQRAWAIMKPALPSSMPHSVVL